MLEPCIGYMDVCPLTKFPHSFGSTVLWWFWNHMFSNLVLIRSFALPHNMKASCFERSRVEICYSSHIDGPSNIEPFCFVVLETICICINVPGYQKVHAFNHHLLGSIWSSPSLMVPHRQTLWIWKSKATRVLMPFPCFTLYSLRHKYFHTM